MKARLTAALLAIMLMAVPVPCLAGEADEPIDQEAQEEQVPEEEDIESMQEEDAEDPAAEAGKEGEEDLAEEVLEEELEELYASGWKKTAKGTSYYVNGKAATGWKTINGETYYFGKDGLMKTLWQTIGGFKYYFGKDGRQALGWKTIDGETCYFFPRTIGNNYKGTLAKGWRDIGGKTYYLGQDGKMRTFWQTINGYLYYFGQDGAQRTGLQRIGGHTYYFYKSTIKKYKGHYKGAAAAGLIEDRGRYYFMKRSGKDKYKALTGICTLPERIDSQVFTLDKGTLVYFTEDGSLYDGPDWSIISIGSSKYFHESSGRLGTGFKVMDGKLYYFDPSSAKMRTGWVWASADEGSIIDGRYAGFESTRRTKAWWYFGNDGAFQAKKGWQTISGKKFYFGSYKDSVYNIKNPYFAYPMMLAGQAKVNGKYYIFNTKDGLQTGWITGDEMPAGKAANGGGKGARFYVGSDGAVKTGWQKIGGRTYYLAPSANHKGYIGQLLTGSNIYKASKSGLSYMFEMKYYKKAGGADQYKVKIGSAWYVINKDGSLVKKL